MLQERSVLRWDDGPDPHRGACVGAADPGGLQALVTGTMGQLNMGTPSILLTQGSNRLLQIGHLSHSFHFPGRLAHVRDG